MKKIFIHDMPAAESPDMHQVAMAVDSSGVAAIPLDLLNLLSKGVEGVDYGFVITQVQEKSPGRVVYGVIGPKHLVDDVRSTLRSGIRVVVHAERGGDDLDVPRLYGTSGE